MLSTAEELGLPVIADEANRQGFRVSQADRDQCLVLNRVLTRASTYSAPSRIDTGQLLL